MTTPTKAELQSAYGKTIPDQLDSNLRIWFVGINPSLYSAAVGHHFARPGNRFWPALADSELTPRLYLPQEDAMLPELGLGLTNFVARATARGDELSVDELRQGAEVLAEKVSSLAPRCLAFLGITAFRTAFGQPRAELGEQELDGLSCRVWVLPNPSGLNAHYQRPDFKRLFGELREAFGAQP